MNLTELKIKIKRRESPFYDRVYRFARSVKHFEMPYIGGLHDFGFHERRFRVSAWRGFWRIVYHQPLFRSRCVECGKRLYIDNTGQGLPLLEGNLKMYIGDDVFIYDRITIAGLTVADEPIFRIGDNSVIGMPVGIMIGKEVSIGSNCLIACSLIADNYKRRFKKLHKILIGKVKIGNYVMAAHQSMIVGNVTIGDGAIIGVNCVVTEDVPPFCMVAGNPARIVKKLPFPKEMREILGEEQYNNYLEAKIEA
jgi:acetyltransferase-like isoleucine patch superfamily enzyme